MKEFVPKPRKKPAVPRKKKVKYSNYTPKNDKGTRSPYVEARDILGHFQEIGDRKNWIMEKLDAWSKLQTSIAFFDFLDEYGIPEQTYYDILNRDAELFELHHRAKQRIGSRREKMAIFKYNECNEKTLLSTLRVYNEDWKKVYDEDRDNRKELADKGVREPISIKFERD